MQIGSNNPLGAISNNIQAPAGKPVSDSFEASAAPQQTVAQADVANIGGGSTRSSMAFPGLDPSPTAGLGGLIKKLEARENAARKGSGLPGV